MIHQYIQERDAEKLKPYFAQANQVFKDQERHFRSDAVHMLVEEHGLVGYLKAHSDQTRPRADTVAVFAMAPNNTERVREIYSGSGFTPVIETLSAYATQDPSASLPNAFARGSAFYHSVIDQLVEQIPKAIARFLESQ